MSLLKTIGNIGLTVLPQLFLPPGVAQAVSIGGKAALNGLGSSGGGAAPVGGVAKPAIPQIAAPFSQEANTGAGGGMPVGGLAQQLNGAQLGLLPALLSHIR